MQGFIKKYICHCDMCKRSKGSKLKKQSIFWPLLVPDQRWQDISINFVTGISAIKSANAICNIVNRLSKEHYYITTNKKIDTKKRADFFVYHIWKLHCLPKSIISDCGIQFINNFWKFFCKRLGINIQLSTI